MTLSQTDRASYRWFTISLIVASGVYAWYTVSQYDRLNDLNQRQLSNAAAELRTALDNAVVTVEQFNGKWTAADAKSKAPVCDFVSSQPYLALTACSVSNAPETVKWSTFTAVEPVTTPALGIRASVSGKAGPGGETFRFRTDKLLQELAFSDSFSLIFVAKPSGEVLFQDAPTRRRWLRQLRWGEQTFRDAHADRPPLVQIHNLQEVLGSEATWKQLRSVSSQTGVRLGGVSHQLYLQPLLLAGGESMVIVGGAVPTTSVLRDALALDTHLLSVLVFLLLLGILGFPFVKLAFLDCHERLRLRDISRLYLSTGALLVLFTCASLAIDGYVRWHAQADRGLETLAEHLEGRLIAEVRAIRDQVNAYDRAVSEHTSTMSVRQCQQWPVQTKWFGADKPGHLEWPRDTHLRQVAWIGPEGRQIWKSTADAIPGKTWVDRRVYFRAVRDGNLFQVRDEQPAFFFGPDRSIADGKFYTFISMSSRIAPNLCDPEAVAGTPVVAASAQLLSLDAQPLPVGYGFALVNREGRVLYHSDRRLSLRENLYEELGHGARARAIIYAGLRHDLKSRYRERPHEFYFLPTRLVYDNEPVSTPFYLVTFRDTSVERTLVGHVFVAGLAGPMLLLLVIYGIAVLVLTRCARYMGRGWGEWLWPHGGLDHIYRRQTAAFGVLLLASALAYIRYQSVAGFLMLPLVASVVAVGIYAHGARSKGARRPLSRYGWQTLAVLLALVCIVVLPSAALFRLTLNYEFAKLILIERDSIEAQKNDVLTAAEVDDLANRYALSRSRRLADIRDDYFSCVPAPFDASLPEPRGGAGTSDAVPTSSVPGGESHLVRCEDRRRASAERTRRPVLVSIEQYTGGLNALHSLDSLLPIENEILARQHFQPQYYAYSPEGTLLTPVRASGVAFVGFALTLGLLVWWIQWNTYRLFLADEYPSDAITPPSGSFDALFAGRTVDEQMVLLQIAQERIANPYQRPIVTHLLQEGLLRLDPDVRPFSQEFDSFLRERERELHAELAEWQDARVVHSWRYARVILLASVAGLGFFLIATQPGLQSSLIGIASAITGALTAGLKLREAVGSWFTSRTSNT